MHVDVQLNFTDHHFPPNRLKLYLVIPFNLPILSISKQNLLMFAASWSHLEAVVGLFSPGDDGQQLRGGVFVWQNLNCHPVQFQNSSTELLGLFITFITKIDQEISGQSLSNFCCFGIGCLSRRMLGKAACTWHGARPVGPVELGTSAL